MAQANYIFPFVSEAFSRRYIFSFLWLSNVCLGRMFGLSLANRNCLSVLFDFAPTKPVKGDNCFE